MMTEQELLEWYARRKQRRARWRREAKQAKRDEEREVTAQAKHCLIEAYEAMRGHPDLPVRPVIDEISDDSLVSTPDGDGSACTKRRRDVPASNVMRQRDHRSGV